ncbi:hypothetical protein ACH4C6_06225 [Streptomyces sp. NPDC017943]|uniref:hypothetical protein n=1 Tax=Streptomyces sp. NPDC017943 TaxID=3365019 RepID=UPI00379BFAF5
MSSPDDELSHPLEEVTGEKDVPPEEEGATPPDTGDESGPDDGNAPEASDETRAP